VPRPEPHHRRDIVLPTQLPAPLVPPPHFTDAARSLGIEFDPGDVERLGAFLSLLLETNASFNLTAITDPHEAWTRHILDALTLLPLLSEVTPQGERPLRVIDIGSGGGVPAIPLAIVLPQMRITLLEPTGKKAAFLRHAAALLDLGGVTVIQGRAENLGQDIRGAEKGDGLGPHREGYDAVTARALGHLAVLAELALPLARPGGLVLAIKGARADQEIQEATKAIGLLGGRHAATVETPTGRVVVLEKASRTPRTYPRRDGEPKRAPLGMASPAPDDR
jgi:16S rRNA (guanine527-N7)-methyltransferase